MDNVQAMPEPLKVENHGKGPMQLTHLDLLQKMGKPVVSSRITEIHMNEDGCIDDTPLFAFVSVLPKQGFIVSQITMNTLNYALGKLGYEIRRKS